MVYFGENNPEFWELEELNTEDSVRIIIPCEKYFILATSVLVRTNKGLLRKLSSGEIQIYHKSLETLIKSMREHKTPHKMDLLRAVSYESYF